MDVGEHVFVFVVGFAGVCGAFIRKGGMGCRPFDLYVGRGVFAIGRYDIARAEHGDWRGYGSEYSRACGEDFLAFWEVLDVATKVASAETLLDFELTTEARGLTFELGPLSMRRW